MLAIIFNKYTARFERTAHPLQVYTTTTCVALKAVFVGHLAFVCAHHKESAAVLAGARYVMTYYT